MHIVGQRCPWFCGSSHSPTPIWSSNPGCMREWSKGWMCQAFAESGCTSHHDCSEAHDCQLLISRVPIPEPPQSRRNEGSAHRRDNALRGLLRVLLHCVPAHRHNPALGTPPHILPNRLIASPPMQPQFTPAQSATTCSTSGTKGGQVHRREAWWRYLWHHKLKLKRLHCELSHGYFLTPEP